MVPRKWHILSAWLTMLPLNEVQVYASPLLSTTTRPSFPAFAAPSGGFGGGGFSKKSKKSRGKKQKKGSLLSEVVSAPSKQSPSSITTADKPTDKDGPVLDKWGLPIPTEDDLFPPMSPGTEIISVTDNQQFTLSDIRAAMKDHIELASLQERFDEQCIEKNPLPGRKPMKLRLLHQSPPVLTVENFFTEEECEQVKSVVSPQTTLGTTQQSSSDQKAPLRVQSATFSALAQSKRTSTSWFCYYSQVPTLLAKAHHVLGIPTLEQMEEPQIVRYKTGQEFSWHYDEVPAIQLKNGGQRLATLLVYLNDVTEGGGTVFRDLQDGTTGEMLAMKPKKGSALLFFPAYKDGRADERTLHKGEVAGDEKWIVQMWIHERDYRATLPDDNFQQFAKEDVDRVSRELGYI